MNAANSAVNRDIAPMTASAARRHIDWQIFPLQGNCADYAVTKRHLLIQFGWATSSLLLAEVAIRATGEHHLVLLVREAGSTFVLDNLDPLVGRLAEALEKYVLVRVQSDRDPRAWIRAAPPRPKSDKAAVETMAAYEPR